MPDESCDEQDLKDFRSFANPACRALGLDTQPTENALLAIAERYSLRRFDELHVVPVSKVLEQLGDLEKAPIDKRWPRRFDGLEDWTLGAIAGAYPVASMTLTELPFDAAGSGIVQVPGDGRFVASGDEDIEGQELKRAIDESASGFVARRRQQGFFEILCVYSTTEALGLMMAAMVRAIRSQALAPEEELHLIERLGRKVFALSAYVDRDSVSTFLQAFGQSSRKTDLFQQFLATQVGKIVEDAERLVETRGDVARFFAESIEDFFRTVKPTHQKAVLLQLANVNETGFRGAVKHLKALLEQQFDKVGNPNGLGRRITRDYSPHAGWLLIIEVLDKVWPAHRGALNKGEQEPVANLVMATFRYGEVLFNSDRKRAVNPDAARRSSSSGIGNTGGSASRDYNPAHLKEIASLRHAILQLDQTVSRLNSRLVEARNLDRGGEQLNRERVDVLEATVLALRTWRRSLHWRLYRGQYDRSKREGYLKVPKFPQLKASLAESARDERIVASATALIETITRRKSGKH
ncbi:hypothetical protein [Shinella zoogloeoides]|uniref:Uncharacterized protein n=1 Tax=Shinella zoogloeoides TaxID=352475 RepID=A0A6N8TIH6_SHIZO|nr:hypothetical protein [Shinella zoogloeoides]MXO03053.1 hypothetical protein [Shinella zoogloeoides]UEX81814.1 hypothetical protein K8M09_00400 [Shinella zoogloeoides]